MTELDLEAIEARVAKTSEGPWVYNSYNGIFSGPLMRTYDAWSDSLPEGHTLERRDECPPCGEWKEPRFAPSPGAGHGCRFFDEDYRRDPEVASVPSHHGDTAIGKRAADAEFIAHARQDVPDLLAALKDARSERDDALRMVLALTGTGPCGFDHHGNCQVHGWVDGQCPKVRAEALLADEGKDTTHGA